MLYSENDYRDFIKGDMLLIQNLLEKYGAIQIKEYFEEGKKSGAQKPKYVIKGIETFTPGKSFAKQLVALITTIQHHAYLAGIAYERENNRKKNKSVEGIIAKERQEKENVLKTNKKYRSKIRYQNEKIVSLAAKIEELENQLNSL